MSIRRGWSVAGLVGGALLVTGAGPAHGAVLQEGDPGERASVGESTAPEESPALYVGLERGGGGLFVRGSDFDIRLMGYIQPTGALFPRSLDRPDAPGAFSVRRARLDLLAEFQDDYALFVELDGAPEGRTALVEAWANWRLRGDGLQIRAGKFIGRFSAENTRSSRDLDTVERFMALNSMFLLPALDTQTGAMVHGEGLLGDRVGYSLGVYNGNGSANVNVPENNAAKEVQAKVEVALRPGLQTAVALDWTRELEQTLELVDLGFNTYAAVPVKGRRIGAGGDISWERGDTSLRAELLGFRFRTPGAPRSGPDGEEPRDVGGNATFHGGFVQSARFLRGGPRRGLQILARGEWVRLDAPAAADTDSLHGITLGLNGFPDANARVQVNGVLTRSNGPSEHQGFETGRWMPMLLAQLQFKL